MNAVKKSEFVMSPFVTLLIAISMSVCGELMLKHGMNNVGTLDLTGWHAIGQLFRTFTNPFVLAGLVVIFGGSIFWLSVLSKAELSWAYPMLSLSYVAGVFLSAVLLNETVTGIRIAGVLVIVFGVFLVYRS